MVTLETSIGSLQKETNSEAELVEQLLQQNYTNQKLHGDCDDVCGETCEV